MGNDIGIIGIRWERTLRLRFAELVVFAALSANPRYPSPRNCKVKSAA